MMCKQVMSVYRYKIFFFTCGLVMAVSEIWKQWCLTFLLGQGHYNWWHFPFQLCSIPMYICLMFPWIHSEKLQKIMLVFLMDYGLLGGIFAFFDTSGMHYSYFPLTIHSFTWHILLIILGLVAGFSQLSEYSLRGYFHGTLLYLACCLIATGFNVALHSLGNINLFYISPYLPMNQKVFRDIADYTGDAAGIFLYILASVAGAFCFHLLWRTISADQQT